VIFEANLEIYSVSSTAELPPPITTTSLFSKYLASQVAQYDIPFPFSSLSPVDPVELGYVPVAMMIFFALIVSKPSITTSLLSRST
jgi:hypothetical protein